MDGLENVHLAYCAGCDRQVRVAVDPEVLEAGREPTPADLICLEHGRACTGELCPIFNVPSDEMRQRYASLLERRQRGEA